MLNYQEEAERTLLGSRGSAKRSKSQAPTVQVKYYGKVYSICCDSPSTKQSIAETGYCKSYFKDLVKQIEKTKESELTENIKNLRIEYYHKRLANAINIVNERRKEIKHEKKQMVASQRKQDTEKRGKNKQDTLDDSETDSVLNYQRKEKNTPRKNGLSEFSINKRANSVNNSRNDTQSESQNDFITSPDMKMGTNRNQKQNIESASPVKQKYRNKNNDSELNFKRVIQYLKSNHKNPDISPPQDILKSSDDSPQFTKEIQKYNKKKQLEQFKASQELSIVLKELQKEEKEKDRIQKKIMKEMKDDQEEQYQMEKKRRKWRDELENKKEKEAEYEEQRKNQLNSFKYKMEQLKQKHGYEKDFLIQKKEQKERAQTEIKYKTLSQIHDNKEQESFKRTMLQTDLDQKMYCSEQMHNHQINQKKEQLREKFRQDKEIYDNYKKIEEDKINKNLRNFLDKLENNKMVAIKHIQDVMEKDKKKKEHISELNELRTNNIMQIQNQKEEQLTQREQKLQQYNKYILNKKKQDEEELNEKKEKALLRQMEIKDNEEIQKRKKEYEFQQYFQRDLDKKEKFIQEQDKLKLLDIARKENNIHQSLETERIQRNMDYVTQKILNKNSKFTELNKTVEILKTTIDDKKVDYSIFKLQKPKKEQSLENRSSTSFRPRESKSHFGKRESEVSSPFKRKLIC
ncbi:hypothetical protein TTHERM_00389770 (macronuclear) [Tetrahymena thermophila SB210]|uniref:Uncharacterized protein n=1 Tax=Tetrahymena thermophila (strain SB210) TaxID=312017 RepID=Q23RB1_TETTS|nr:hypothetical protein TTHERM_00389770 [Tetrahymena thermophila SB210]EAR99137.2 hypothetical protein TTHERM_00389770 [Tetrahymena thermophila SB210]|eukprot:XP_001019382.2 hypothetical protein TTHERM_00389770 [Tetrahymena thermophila SB210]